MALPSVGNPGGFSGDRTLFVGSKVPQEIKSMVKLLKSSDKSTFRELLKAAVSSFEGTIINEDFIPNLSNECGQSSDALSIIYSGILTLLRAAYRLPLTSLKQELFKADLSELKIPPEYATDFASAVYGPKRTAINDALERGRVRFPKLDNFRWRVDVAISTSALSRSLEPTIMAEMTLSDGRIQSFEIPVSKFHELRYNVASLMKEMEDLEKKNILKIQD
ncbi:COMM domain-containing protein 5-like [Lytechinus pictus]|uniref:COMM domain-containing protein 5-like n=1 Tax=Lytechinus pictus TaxID=7653 RepID=UPI00240E749F|nr:COMM domain-containing protein 5-like [Lytechinus pictus]